MGTRTPVIEETANSTSKRNRMNLLFLNEYQSLYLDGGIVFGLVSDQVLIDILLHPPVDVRNVNLIA
jgi:hypothetical protein